MYPMDTTSKVDRRVKSCEASDSVSTLSTDIPHLVKLPRQLSEPTDQRRASGCPDGDPTVITTPSNIPTTANPYYNNQDNGQGCFPHCYFNVSYDSAVELAGIGRFHYALIFCCGYMFLAVGLENNINAYILPSVHCDLHISSSQMGYLNAAFLVGGILSNFMWGVLADMVGRKTVLVYGMLLDGILTLVSSLSQHFAMLIAFRFLAGFIVGGPSSIVFAYMGEFLPDRIRSKVICYSGISWTLSWVFMPAVAWIIIPMKWSLGGEQFRFNSWRLLLAFEALPCLSSAALLSFFPESPKFVLMHGDNQGALDILANVYMINKNKKPTDYPVKSLRSYKPLEVDTSEADAKSVCRPVIIMLRQTLLLFNPPTIITTSLTSLYFFSNMFGYYGLGLWLPELFNRMSNHLEVHPEAKVTMCTSGLDLSVNSTSADAPCDPTDVETEVFTKSLIMGMVGLAGNIGSGALANRLHRRTLPVVLMALSGICVVALYFTTNMTVNLVLASAFQFNVGTANLVYISVMVDMFPPKISGMGVCVAILMGRLGAMVSNLVFGILLDVNCSVPIFLVAAVLFVGSFFSVFIPKEPYSDKAPSTLFKKKNQEVFVIT